MSAFVLVLDVILAAVVIRYALPVMDDSTRILAVILGLVVIVWKWERY